MFGCVRRFFLLVGSWFRWLRSEAADLRDSLQQYHHLKPKVEMKKCVSNQAVGMKDVQACTSDLGKMNLIDQEKMTTAAAFLFWNHTLRDLCESQLPENKDSKKERTGNENG
nr:coiled-coil domain-containing protein 144A-like [Pan paniscus]